MKCYIRKPSFSHRSINDIGKYEIYLHSADNKKSQIVLPKYSGEREDDFVYCDNGFKGIIKSIEPDSKTNKVTLHCIDMLNIFDRDVVDGVLPDDALYQEPIVRDWINDHFISNADDDYNYLFLRLGNKKTITCVADSGMTYGQYFVYPDPVNDKVSNLFNMLNYINKLMQRLSIFTELNIAKGNKVDVTVLKKSPTTRIIDFSDSTYELLDSNYSNDITAKVTTITESGTTTHYYLKTDGTITTSKPATGRETGKWKTIVIPDSADSLDKATSEFEKNKYTHLIEFSSLRELNFFDPVQIRIKGRVFNSYISSIKVTNESNQYFYESGELKVTLQDRLREALSWQ